MSLRRLLTADEIRALVPKVAAGDFGAIATIFELSPFLGGEGTTLPGETGGGGSITGDAILEKLGQASPTNYEAFQRQFLQRLASGAPRDVSAMFFLGDKASSQGLPVTFEALRDLNPTGIEALDTVRAGTAGVYVPTIAAIEAVREAKATVTLGASATLDLAQGPNFQIALNDTGAVLNLFANWRAGVEGRISLTSDGSNTITFAAVAGVTIEPLSAMTANTGAGARTHYEYWTEASGGANRVCIRAIGGGVTAPGGSAPTLTSVVVTNDATTAGYGLWNTQFSVAENSAGETSLAYQWKLNGADISGATSTSYTPTVGALAGTGTGLTCVVTATNAYGSVSLESAPVTVMYAGWVPSSAASTPNTTSTTRSITGYTVMSGQRFVQIAFGQANAAGGLTFTLNGNAPGAGGTAQVVPDTQPATNHRVYVNTVSDVTGASFSSVITCPVQTVSDGFFQLVGYDVSNDTAVATSAVSASNATAGSLAVNKGANAVMLAMAKGWELITDADFAQDTIANGGTINNFWAAGVMSKLAADNTTASVTTDTAAANKIAAAVVFAKA